MTIAFVCSKRDEIQHRSESIDDWLILTIILLSVVFRLWYHRWHRDRGFDGSDRRYINCFLERGFVSYVYHTYPVLALCTRFTPTRQTSCTKKYLETTRDPFSLSLAVSSVPVSILRSSIPGTTALRSRVSSEICILSWIRENEQKNKKRKKNRKKYETSKQKEKKNGRYQLIHNDSRWR